MLWRDQLKFYSYKPYDSSVWTWLVEQEKKKKVNYKMVGSLEWEMDFNNNYTKV